MLTAVLSDARLPSEGYVLYCRSMKEEFDFATTKEAAKIIGVDYRTLENWRSRNKNGNGNEYPNLKHTKVGKKIFYFKKSLMEFIRKNTVGEE